MAIISLNRRFFEWGEKDPPDPEIRRAFDLEEGGVGWDELLLKPRVVILAEAGSGKSTELADRARITSANGRYSFLATVQDVGADGLEGALTSSARKALGEWLASEEDAWFFIDSVDEAKSRGIRLDKALRKLADGIYGAERRAHIVLSGRITDWEFRRDLDLFKTLLPIPSSASASGIPAEEEILKTLRQERREEPSKAAPEKPFVARMMPLDRERVRLFAEGKRTADLDAFLDAVDGGDLWHFAARPLDLDWLVRFWQAKRRLGSVAEMVEQSITERLKEPDRDRARLDPLDAVAARHAVERLGAAMVFSRQSTVAIPDGEMGTTPDSSLRLQDVLPDWSEEHCARLLVRPIFDPATLGRARFHNDNHGVVRAYLTAQWLHRLRAANLSTKRLFELVFAKSYGLKVVRPSMRETAAWLAICDHDVAREVVEIDPVLLLTLGDPASISAGIRHTVLVELLSRLAKGDQELPWINDSLRRFAQPDLGAAVAGLWPQHRANKKSAEFLLRLAWLGQFGECAAFAYDAALDDTLDPLARVFAARVVMAADDDALCKRYADVVVAQMATLPTIMLRDAIAEMAPAMIGVSDVLTILRSASTSEGHGEFAFDTEGPRLVRKLTAASDVEALLRGLLEQLGGELGQHGHHEPTKREEEYFPAMAEAALRLLRLSPPECAPECAVDAILRICNRRDLGRKVRTAAESALGEIHRTAARRRAAFWRVVQNLRDAPTVVERIDLLWKIEMLGYKAGFQVEDVDWLVADGIAKGNDDCRIAVTAAFALCRSAGAPPEMLARIGAATQQDSVAAEIFRELSVPWQPPPEHVEMGARLRRMDARNARERAKRDRSWIDFINELKNDPARIDRLRVPPTSGFNSDLLDLLRLLHGSSGRSSYAIESIAPLERMAGPRVAEAVQAGLMAHWRHSAPQLRSERRNDDRNSILWVDIMGIVGVTLESVTVTNWAKRLSPPEATCAAGYATLELNGFPRWITELVAAKPAETRNVLMGEIVDELNRPELTYRETLNKVAYAPSGFSPLLSSALLDDLEQRTRPPVAALPLLLTMIAAEIAPEDTVRLIALGTARFATEADSEAAVHYLSAVFALAPQAAAQILVEKIDSLGENERLALLDRFLRATFGRSVTSPSLPAVDVPAETLEQLVRFTFRTKSGQRRRPVGVVYRMDEHDYTDEARDMVFNRFVQTPGAATYQGLLRLQSDPACPIPAARLGELAVQRAILDSESAPWAPGDALEFEESSEMSPRVAKDLQAVVVGRIEDMQHDLLRGDFAQGVTLRLLPHEAEVQRWVAESLRLRQGRAFSVEREPHVVDEKEPDIRIRAKASDAVIAVEIKVAETWSLRELDEALEAQLCGRYLSARSGRYGILLLVHKEPRPRGWQDTATGATLSFAGVVLRLSRRAAEIAGAHHDAPQPEVCVLDVAGIADT